MNIQPIGDRILVKPAEAEEKTASGIYIPDTAKEKPSKGKILAIGSGRYSEQNNVVVPLTVKVGDEVLYGKYGGTEITLDGETYLIMRENDVYAVIGSEKQEYDPKELVDMYKAKGIIVK